MRNSVCSPTIVSAAILLVVVSCSCREQQTSERGKATDVAGDTVQLTNTLELVPARKVLDRVSIIDHSLAILQDPKNDGWESEAFADAAAAQLKTLARAIADGVVVEATLSRVADTKQPFGDLRPSNLVETFRSNDVTVYRADSSNPADENAPLAEQLQLLLKPFGENARIDSHFKIIAVDLSGDRATTRVLFDAKSVRPEAVQLKATWDCKWNRDSESLPTLTAIEASHFEEVHSKAAPGVWFSDRTEDVLSGDSAYSQQLAIGLNHWMERIERSQLMDDSVRNGLAIGDVNNDGRDDVYVCQAPGLPNRMLLHNTDGTVRDCAADSGTDWLDQTSAALMLDFDNDGNQDLAVATRGGLLIMKNDGTAKFELMAQLGPDGIDSQSLTSVDFDQDGDLDLFVCAYRPADGRRSGDFVFHDAITGGENYLFRNDVEGASWTWTDVTATSGLSVGSTRYSLAAGWEDFDNDGDQDLYVANDYGRNYLYRNDGGRFTDVTELSGLKDTGFGMSVGWGDFNNDGDMDLYVGNMFSSAGSRITSDPKFQPNSSEEQKAIYRRMAKGNSLFTNHGGSFTEITDTAGVGMGRWAWSSIFTDLNNDGLDDIIVANGYITTDDSGDL
jgi:hypothetical protein